jgi:hypothetical protein
VFVEALSAGSLLVIPWVDAAGSVLLVLSDSSIYSLVLQFFHMNRLLRIPYHIYERSGGKLKRWVPELWTYLETTSPGILGGTNI